MEEGLAEDEYEGSDEIFWHATTFSNVRRIYESTEGIKPELGSGANGPGFYVCPRRTDYMKAMAFRNKQEDDPKEMFILKILVNGFYDMKPYFSDGLAGTIADTCDFVGSRWASDVVGDSEISKPEGGGTGGKGQYDAYQGKAFGTPGYKKDKKSDDKREYVGGSRVKGWKARAERRQGVLDALWEAAKANQIPKEGKESKKMNKLMESLGPRKAFLDTLEELTFKNPAGPRIFIVGARKFYSSSPNDQLANWFDDDTEVELKEVEEMIESTK